MDKRKEILCYGDSNTWGCVPRWQECVLPSERYSEDVRWPGAAAKLLGSGYHLIEEGLGGRTTIYDRPGEPWKNGSAYLLPCLMSHRPLDLVVLMLGTNDLHQSVLPERGHGGDGIRELIGIVQSQPKCGRGNTPPPVLVIAPPAIRQAKGRVLVYGRLHGDAGRDYSLALPQVYREAAEENGCFFLNSGEYASPSDADGVHLNAESHLALGEAVARKIREIFEGSRQ